MCAVVREGLPEEVTSDGDLKARSSQPSASHHCRPRESLIQRPQSCEVKDEPVQGGMWQTVLPCLGIKLTLRAIGALGGDTS